MMTTTHAPLRSDLQQLLDELDAVDAAVDALVSSLSDAQFLWRPDAGLSWSVGQCLEHLAVTNALYGHAIRQSIDEARARGLGPGGPIAPTFFGRQFIRSMEPPVRRRFRAPGAIAPRSSRTRDEIMRAFREGHDRFRETIRSAADVDVNRTTFVNPFFRFARVRVGTGLRVVPAHDRRHVWQAQNVTQAPGFPTAG